MGSAVVSVRKIPSELWFHGVSAKAIRHGRVQATVCLDRRDRSHENGYVVGERVVLRCFTWDEVAIAVLMGRVTDLQCKMLAAVRTSDLAACAANENTRGKLERHLAVCYRRPIAPTEIVTIVHFACVGNPA